MRQSLRAPWNRQQQRGMSVEGFAWTLYDSMPRNIGQDFYSGTYLWLQGLGAAARDPDIRDPDNHRAHPLLHAT
jgi:hypothetical protein